MIKLQKKKKKKKNLSNGEGDGRNTNRILTSKFKQIIPTLASIL